LQMSELPPEFAELWNDAALLLSPRAESGGAKIRAVPASVQQAADRLEEGQAFTDFVRSAPWDVGEVASWRVGQALRRAGFYHAVQSGGSPDSVWESLKRHLAEYTAIVRTFVLLDGARFPVDHFTLGDVQVRRLSVNELERLGPAPHVARAFFPNEYLDPKWFTNVWFLVTEEERGRKPTGIHVRFGYNALRRFWKPLIALALYNPAYFGNPIVIESEVGWQLERIQWADPMIDIREDEEIPRSDYDVKPEETERFLAYLQFFDKAIGPAADFSAFRIASRRHLRALSIGGPYVAHADDEYEDALLQYVFALEALLGGENAAIADKIATRCAWVVGIDDDERRRTFKAVKELYDLRSAVVHGDSVANAKRKRARASAPDLEAVRDLVRRALLGVLATRQTVQSNDEVQQLLSSASVDRGAQERIGSTVETAREMIEPLPNWTAQKWGPQFRPRRSGKQG
jgi:Apea-like HEPN